LELSIENVLLPAGLWSIIFGFGFPYYYRYFSSSDFVLQFPPVESVIPLKFSV